jgi:DNA polymerase-3 subunit delta'
MLFVGPAAVGKYTIAQAWAQHLTGSVEGHVQPDILLLEPERETKKGIVREKDIKVGAARDILRELAFLPQGEGKRRVLIIRDAHRLTEKAQNALLKTVEEPAPHMLIILVTHALGHIVPTLLSRCQTLSFSAVPEAVLRAQYADRTVPDILFSLGRPGLLEQYLATPEAWARDIEAVEWLRRVGCWTVGERLAFSEQLTKDTSRTLRVLEWWASVWRQEALSLGQSEHFLGVARITEALRELTRSGRNARLVVDTLLLSW